MGLNVYSSEFLNFLRSREAKSEAEAQGMLMFAIPQQRVTIPNIYPPSYIDHCSQSLPPSKTNSLL